MNKTMQEQLNEMSDRILKIEKKLETGVKDEKKRKRRSPQKEPEPENRDPQNLHHR